MSRCVNSAWLEGAHLILDGFCEGIDGGFLAQADNGAHEATAGRREVVGFVFFVDVVDFASMATANPLGSRVSLHAKVLEGFFSPSIDVNHVAHGKGHSPMSWGLRGLSREGGVS